MAAHDVQVALFVNMICCMAGQWLWGCMEASPCSCDYTSDAHSAVPPAAVTWCVSSCFFSWLFNSQGWHRVGGGRTGNCAPKCKENGCMYA